MDLSIIIVNYNGLKYLSDCLNSIYENTTGVDIEIIIFDNNSTDGSINYLKNNFLKVLLIESKANLGFAKGNNIAAKYAKGDYILLLNNDTILLSPLSPVLQTIKEDNSIGAIGIKMLNAKKEYICSTGKFPQWYNIFLIKNISYLIKNFSTVTTVDWISGSFIIIPKNIWVQINGFTEDFFMYAEDVDLCKKIDNLGYKKVFYPFASYIHFVGFQNSRNKLLIKSLKLYCDKNMNFIERNISKLFLSINLLVKKLRELLS